MTQCSTSHPADVLLDSLVLCFPHAKKYMAAVGYHFSMTFPNAAGTKRLRDEHLLLFC